MTNTTELKKLAEAASLTGAQLVGMSAPEFAEAQRLKQQFRQIRPEAILNLLAINAELVEALKEISTDYADRFDLESPSTNPGIKSSITQARAALAKAEGGEL